MTPAARSTRHPRAACAATGPGAGAGHPRHARPELAARFAQRLVEVLSGLRPPGQLARHTTHDGYRQLARLAHGGALRPSGGAGRARLGPVHDFAPAAGSLEVCVRVETGHRHHLLAFRLERHRHTEQWQCAAVETR
ncbi:hypothetical protein GCM10009665_18330 [Kitasatospora nipponensis]|uniref:Uncharacterized protein n=1 Tax=Kitasatospora nipponensis TaxID=258049 RepID=A0ABN1W377_9ACTN